MRPGANWRGQTLSRSRRQSAAPALDFDLAVHKSQLPIFVRLLLRKAALKSAQK